MRRWPCVLLLLLPTLLSGCSKQRAEVTCGPALHPDALAKGLLILGELHGIDQSPAATLATACDAAKREGRAWIGLEIPHSEQAAIDAFLAGGSKETLLKSPLWTREVQDGRSSQAMFGLLERVHELRMQGLKLDVVAFDAAPADGFGRRDKIMAEQIQRARDARPGARGVVLVGGGHATRRLALPKPMAWHLDAAGVPFISLEMAHLGGMAWLSGDSTGGEDPQLPRGPSPEAFTEGFSRESPEAGFDGWWFAGGRLTASPPAIQPRR